MPFLILDTVSTKDPSVSYKVLDKEITLINASETIKDIMKTSTEIPEDEYDDIITFIKSKWIDRISKPESLASVSQAGEDWADKPSERMATFAETLWNDPSQAEKLAPITTAAFRKSLREGKYGKVAQRVWK
jgi:hypothetical protein